MSAKKGANKAKPTKGTVTSQPPVGTVKAEVKAPETKKASYVALQYSNLRINLKKTITSIVNGEKIQSPGAYVQFNKGVFVTEDQDIIAGLEAHPDFGKTFSKAKKAVSMAELEQKYQSQLKSVKEEKDAEIERLNAEVERLSQLEKGKAVAEDEPGVSGEQTEKPAFE